MGVILKKACLAIPKFSRISIIHQKIMKSLTLSTLATLIMAGILAPMPSVAKTADNSKSSSVSASGKKKGKKSKGKKNKASKKKKTQPKKKNDKKDARKLAIEKLLEQGIAADAYDARLLEAIFGTSEHTTGWATRE